MIKRIILYMLSIVLCSVKIHVLFQRNEYIIEFFHTLQLPQLTDDSTNTPEIITTPLYDTNEKKVAKPKNRSVVTKPISNDVDVINITSLFDSSKHIYYEEPSFALKQNPYVPYYYNPRLGVLYDSVSPTLNHSHTVFTINSPISVLTSTIKDETEEEGEYITSLSTWKKRYKKFRSEVRKSYETNNVDRTLPPYTEPYSRVFYWSNPTMGTHILYGNNMCYNPQKEEVYFFLPKNETLVRDYPKTGFFFSFQLKEVHEMYNPVQKPIHDSGITFVCPHQKNQIYHSLEGMGLVLHKLFSAEEIPYVSEIINNQISASDCRWIKEIMEIIMNNYPLETTSSFYTHEHMYNFHNTDYGLMCFDSMFFDRMSQHGDGGFLSGFIGTDWIRSLVYKHFYLHPTIPSRQSYKLLFLHRTNNRLWVNPKYYIRLIKQRFGKRVDIVNHILSASSLETQVKAFYQANILLGPHGAGLTNSIFLIPHSVVIEVSPPHFIEFCLAGVILHARLHYIYVSNFNYSELIENNIPFPDEEYAKGNYFPIRSRYKTLNLNNNAFPILSAVEDAVAYLDHYQMRSVNDYLSPIFF